MSNNNDLGFERNILSITECQTRKTYIDPELRRSGWLKKYIKEEVNSVNSPYAKYK